MSLKHHTTVTENQTAPDRKALHWNLEMLLADYYLADTRCSICKFVLYCYTKQYKTNFFEKNVKFSNILQT